MKTIEIKENTSLAPFPCEACGGLMRLVGSEPHPVEAKVDLLTFNCTACGAFHVSPVEIPTLES
jgi:transcription elongation factor Elf1